ncbi:DUF4362 domain-containing protein [Actinoplanes sp. DH11]|uniref:DUF4362 domain-containing protein n=1 Tax=Actinoplanes sp. DH11 TaxID=2857011 RepID=UPI001E47577A|nr:DUF4362 domain-containing protein [Actinoplanes sp. DH11]
MKRIVTMMLAGATLAACGQPAPDRRTEPAASPVPDCGTFLLGQGEKVPADAATCLIDAAKAGRVTTLKVTSPTVEGDPIPVTYAARPDGRVDVTTDSRADNFGEQTISRETCSEPALTRDGIAFTECSDLLRVEE